MEDEFEKFEYRIDDWNIPEIPYKCRFTYKGQTAILVVNLSNELIDDIPAREKILKCECLKWAKEHVKQATSPH